MAFPADLKNTLILNPAITFVYFNAAQTAWEFSNEIQESFNDNDPGPNPYDLSTAYTTALSAAYVLAN